MKKIFTVFAALVCGMAMNAKTLYLTPGKWAEAEATIFAHTWAGEDWSDVQLTGSGVMSVEISDNHNMVIFIRMPNGSTSFDWNNNWGKTGDMEIPSDKNMYVFTDWNDGHWEVYNAGGGEQPGGGDNPGGNPGGGEDDKDYYLMGNKNGMESGNIVVPTAEELFEGGQLTYSFPGHAENGNRGYFFIMVCDPGATVGVQYMLKDYSEAKHATLYQAQANNAYAKLGVPGPTVTFYLYYGKEAGTFELSTEPLEGYTLVGGGSAEQGIRNTVVAEKARKVIVDGQLRIMRGDKVYDATGRQL